MVCPLSERGYYEPDRPTVEEIKARNKQLINDVLEVYPEKTAKKRAKHLDTFEQGKPDCGVKSKSSPFPA